MLRRVSLVNEAIAEPEAMAHGLVSASARGAKHERMNKKTAEYTDIRTQPPITEWSAYLRLWSLDNSRLQDLRNDARKRLVQSAQEYVLRLQQVAEDADLETSTSPLLTGDPTQQPVVMTGHQPVPFHSGLTYKYLTTQEFAKQQNAIGVAVVIDTDRGDAGQFSFPQETQEAEASELPVLAIESLSKAHSLYSHGRLRPAKEVRELADHVNGQLLQFDETASAPFSDAMECYASLAGSKATVLEANAITRWRQGIGEELLELPLSAIAAFPECLMLTADILKQPMRFAAAYNGALAAFREEHRIRNGANPFPDLKLGSSRCELPFWYVNHNKGTRHVLEVEFDGNVTRLIAKDSTVDSFAGNITHESLEPMLLQNLQIVPRGALITAFLRLLFSDLFVHGTGGAKYDRFTDELLRSWWNAEPPPFTVASASRYLFRESRQEILRLKDVKKNLRELQYNPQRYFGTGTFSEELEEQLIALMKEKQAVVDCLKSFHADGQSAKDVGKEIQRLTNDIKAAVEEEFKPQLAKLDSITAEQMDAVNCRTYPWFFYVN